MEGRPQEGEGAARLDVHVQSHAADNGLVMNETVNLFFSVL